MKRRLIAVAALAVLTSTALPTTPTPHPAVPAPDEHRDQYPPTKNDIVYSHGGYATFVVTVDPPLGLPGPDCPPGWLCVYAQPHYGYPRGRTQACGYINPARRGWFTHIASAHSNLPGRVPGGADDDGQVHFYHHRGGVPSDRTLHRVLVLTPTLRTAPSVAERVDYLYHRC